MPPRADKKAPRAGSGDRVSVPQKPTVEMLVAGMKVSGLSLQEVVMAYQAMIAAGLAGDSGPR